ncbi:hypothetical protein ACRAWG_07135 [Methylobacterium sp. P31]
MGHLDALRAAALHPQGLRHEAYPTAMPMLREPGHVVERTAKDRHGRVLWHLTPAGRDLLVALGDRPGRQDQAAMKSWRQKLAANRADQR